MMETIGSQKILTFAEGSDEIDALTCSAVRKKGAHWVRNFMDLATKVAELQFRNRDFVLMFRGQPGDYRNRLGFTSLKSTLMRAAASSKVPSAGKIERRFSKLVAAEQALIAE
jgi:hypothetical protein